MNAGKPIFASKARWLLLPWIITVFLPELPAQAPKGLKWEYFGPEQGMGMAFLDILQDSQGFIWLGSTNGLYRYDGYQIRPFKKYSNSPNGLSSDWIWDVEEDGEGNIWIGTYDGGLNKWERASGQIIHFKHNPDNPNSLRGNNVLKVLADTVGDIWVAVKTSEGIPVLDKLNPSTGEVTHYGFVRNTPASLSCDTISISASQAMQLSPLYLDPLGNVWVSTENGLNRYDRGSDGFRQFLHENGDTKSLPYKKVIAIRASHKEEGIYWVRSASPGLENIALSRLDAKTGLSERVPLGGAGAKGSNCLGFVLAGEEDKAWVSEYALDLFMGNGFQSRGQHLEFQSEQDRGAFRMGLYRHSSGNFLLPILGLNPLHAETASDNIYSRNGLAFFQAATNQPYFLEKNPTNENLDFGDIYAIMEDRSGIIWAGCNRGFYKLKIEAGNNRVGPVFENYFVGKPGNATLLSSDIRDISEESRNIFWLASCGGGLSRLDRRAHKVLPFVHDPYNPNSIGSDQVFALWFDPAASQLWIGHGKGLDILSLGNAFDGKPATAVFQHVQDTDGLLNGQINEIEPDGRGNLWIGTGDNGLLLFGPDSKEVAQQIVFNKHNPDPNRSAFINEVFIDSKGRTWVAPGIGGLCRLNATDRPVSYDCFLDGLFIVDFFEASDSLIWCAAMNYGIVKFDPRDGSYELINMENRLVRNSVMGIEADKLGRVWFTSVGLSRYDPHEDTYRVYGSEAGVIGLDPERCFYKSSSGELFYSAINGALQIFTPELVVDNPVMPRAVLTGFRLFNEKVPVGADSPLKENIEVASEIHLAYNQHSFSFEFAGLEYTNPRENQFRYQLVGVDKAWVFSGTYREARYNSVRPGEYLFRVQAANSDGVWNDEPATIKVIIHSPWWSRWWAIAMFAAVFLAAVFLAYRYQLKRKVALEEARRLKEADLLKTRLYTNITHEFRTPLTIILGMADQAVKQPDKWFREGMQMIIRNGQNLLNLVNQMLDLRKIESGVMKVDMRLGDVVTYLKYVTESFHSFAASKGIGLHFLSPLKELSIDYDEDKMLKALSNLLSNAIKYTQEGGNVYVLVDSKKQKGREFLEIRVKDTGIGIPADKQAHIFGHFYQVDDSATRKGEGVGIGLALTQELVKLLGGAISVQSEPGKGSEFIVLLPVSREASDKHTFQEEKVNKVAGEFILADKEIAEEEGQFNADNQGKPIALVIEDNKDVVRYLRSCLEEDYCVEAAYDGRAGIETAIELVPDVIISDVMMPERDGFEVTETLKKDERTSHIPIILLTARATIEDRITGLERGADAYLAKPFNREELMVRMEKMIELRRRLHERYAHLAPLTEPAAPALAIEDNFVRKAREVAEAHLDDPDFGVDGLSDAIFLSRTQVHRKLKALTGKSTGHFIRSIRLAQAVTLIQATSKSITEIAMDVGFKDLAYFTRVFSAEYGKTPSEMRKRAEESRKAG